MGQTSDTMCACLSAVDLGRMCVCVRWVFGIFAADFVPFWKFPSKTVPNFTFSECPCAKSCASTKSDDTCAFPGALNWPLRSVSVCTVGSGAAGPGAAGPGAVDSSSKLY